MTNPPQDPYGFGQASAQITPWNAYADHLAQSVTQVQVRDEAEYQAASIYLRDVVAKRKQVEAMLDYFVGPLKAHIANIKALFGPSLARFGYVEDALRNALGGYANALAAQRAAKMIEAQAQAAQGEVGAFHTAMAAAQVAPPPAAGMGMRENWRWRVVDEGAVPDEWWTLNDKEISKRVRTAKDQHGIPGIEAYVEHSPVVR